MNPNKKRLLIKQVKEAYKVYCMDMAEYIKDPYGINVGNDNNVSANDYYDRLPEDKVKRIKPNIKYYLNKEQQEVLKKILEKKRGFENVDLSE